MAQDQGFADWMRRALPTVTNDPIGTRMMPQGVTMAPSEINNAPVGQTFMRQFAPAPAPAGPPMAPSQGFAAWMQRVLPSAANTAASSPAFQSPVRLPTGEYNVSDMYSGESGLESHLRRPTERQQVQEETARNAPAVFNAPPPTWWQRGAPEFLGGMPIERQQQVREEIARVREETARNAPARPTLAQALTSAAQDDPARAPGERPEGKRAFISGISTLPELLDLMRAAGQMRASRATAAVSPRDQAFHDIVGMSKATRDRRINVPGASDAEKNLAVEAHMNRIATFLNVDPGKLTLADQYSAQRLANPGRSD